MTTHLLDPMSPAIIAGGYQPNDTIRVDLEGPALTSARVSAPSEPEPDGPRPAGPPCPR